MWVSYKDVYKRNASTYPFEKNAANNVLEINKYKGMSVRNAPKNIVVMKASIDVAVRSVHKRNANNDESVRNK